MNTDTPSVAVDPTGRAERSCCRCHGERGGAEEAQPEKASDNPAAGQQPETVRKVAHGNSQGCCCD